MLTTFSSFPFFFYVCELQNAIKLYKPLVENAFFVFVNCVSSLVSNIYVFVSIPTLVHLCVFIPVSRFVFSADSPWVQQ